MPFSIVVFFTIYICCLTVAYVTGYALNRVCNTTMRTSGIYARLFLNLFVGFLLMVLVFSLIKARGNTINLLLLPMLGLLLCNKNIILQSHRTNNKPNAGQIVALALLLLLPFVYFCCIIFKNGTFFYSAVDYDNVIYSRISYQLAESGIENRWLSYFNQTEASPTPYHYFDLWFNALVITVFPVKALPALYLVTYSLLLSISLCGILAIIEKLSPVLPFHVLLPIALITLGPMYFIRTISPEFNIKASELPIEHYGEKYTVYYPFILFSFLLLLNNFIYESLYALVMLCVASFTILPALFIFISATLFLLRNTQRIKRAAGVLLLSFTAFFLFYFFNGCFSQGGDLSYVERLNTQPNVTGIVLHGVGSVIKSMLLFTANYFYAIPVFIFFLMKRRFKSYKVVMLFLVLPFAGLIAMAFFYNIVDNYQLFTNTLPVFHCLLIVLFIMLLFKENISRARRLLIYSFLFTNFIYAVYCTTKEYRQIGENTPLSDEYLQRVQELGNIAAPGSKLAYFYTQKDVIQTLTGHNYLYHLAYTHLDPMPLRMSCVAAGNFSELGSMAYFYESLNRKEPFYNYFNKKISQPGQNPESIKAAFMKERHVNYALLSPGSEMPAFLRRRIKEVVTDKQTNLRFLVLDSANTRYLNP